MSLLQSTQDLLRHCTNKGMSLSDIAHASGGAVEREWLYKFARGDIANPGVNSIQALHDSLKRMKPKPSA